MVFRDQSDEGLAELLNGVDIMLQVNDMYYESCVLREAINRLTKLELKVK